MRTTHLECAAVGGFAMTVVGVALWSIAAALVVSGVTITTLAVVMLIQQGSANDTQKHHR